MKMERMYQLPGPDGFTIEFFKEKWTIVGSDLIVAIQSFFILGFLPKGVTTLALFIRDMYECVIKETGYGSERQEI